MTRRKPSGLVEHRDSTDEIRICHISVALGNEVSPLFGSVTTAVGSVSAAGGFPRTPGFPKIIRTFPSRLNLTTTAAGGLAADSRRKRVQNRETNVIRAPGASVATGPETQSVARDWCFRPIPERQSAVQAALAPIAAAWDRITLSYQKKRWALIRAREAKANRAVAKTPTKKAAMPGSRYDPLHALLADSPLWAMRRRWRPRLGAFLNGSPPLLLS